MIVIKNIIYIELDKANSLLKFPLFSPGTGSQFCIAAACSQPNLLIPANKAEKELGRSKISVEATAAATAAATTFSSVNELNRQKLKFEDLQRKFFKKNQSRNE